MKQKEVVETKYSDITVTVMQTYNEDGKLCYISAIATDRNGKKLSGSKRRTKKWKTGVEDLHAQNAKAVLIARALDSYVATHPQKESTSLSENITAGELQNLFQEFCKSGYPVNPAWSPQTEHAALLAFQRILPHIVNALANGCDPQRLAVAIHNPVTDDVMRNANAKDMATVDKTARKNLLWAEAVLDAMRLAYPLSPAHRLRLNVPKIHGLSSLREQSKALPQAIRDSLTNYLTNCCRLYDAKLALSDAGCADTENLRQQISDLEKVVGNESPRFVLVMLVMYDAGLRTSEAAAITDNSLRTLDCGGHHTTSLVQVWQQERDGKRCKILKSENAYRTVVLSHWGHVMVHIVLDYLKSFDPDWPHTVTSAKGASAWILQQLRKLGIEDHYLDNAATSLATAGEPRIRASEDVSAYILRRDCATRWSFWCGLPLDTVDALLGHARYGRKSSYIEHRDTAWLIDVACKIERYIHMPEYSAAPMYMPYSLTYGTMDIHTPYSTLTYLNTSDQPMRIAVAVTACEPGDDITLHCTKATVGHVRSQDVADTPSKRTERTIFIGNRS